MKKTTRTMMVLVAMAAVLAFSACSASDGTRTITQTNTRTNTQMVTQTSTQTVTVTSTQSVDNTSPFPLTIKTSSYNRNNEKQVSIIQTLEKAPTKVLVGGQTLADFMVYMGLEDMIYGIVYPNGPTSLTGEKKAIMDKIPIITDNWNVTEEEIYVAADAGVDLILTGYVLVGLPSTMDASDINELGISLVYAYNMMFEGSYQMDGSHLVSIASLFDMYRDVGKVLGASAAVEQYITQQRSEMRAILAKIDESSIPQGRTVWVGAYRGSTGDVTWNYSGTVVAEFIALCGGKFIEVEGGLLSSTLELLLSYDPAIIIYRYSAGVDMPLERVEALQDLQAVKNGNAYGSTTLSLTSNQAGLYLSEQLQYIASCLYPDVDFGN